ncbi:type I-E CRISPR-associated protein Cas7/Cse4/CasC [Schaedlerella arabinosiphila]|uniref:Type I-E CRISPR-associated protein Cas7/Cse4/CasC n=1 Tax=Schaedlerella arabinosiphila TaxID=2044587 RepID=A0A9X5C9L0_9FIRM|nr:type I-E CRISPR-associated protein Cas7/Cse4/CasC [Schaedlerella arabinosiphila]NDO70620.1 type I-E CRISPR-associated protein Cas7/Cse4/CasC [Schaedlerella arabinosiphila]
MKKNLYVDLHVIQTVPPSCVNRDDTGSPKTAMYGGAMRARVSSQSWKRAVRGMFREFFTSDHIGYRTKMISELVSDRICKANPDITAETAKKMADTVLELAGVKAGSDKKAALFFISSRQIENIAKLAVDYERETAPKKEKEKSFKSRLENALKENPSVDILLFGRMAASNPTLNYDAAAQVAHSISTHAVSNEYDYFTAVDDCSPEDNAGAGHLGTVEFNSSTLYRYATVNIRELEENLEPDELKMAVRGFAEAFVRSMPTGKQNTFANRTLPDMVYVTFREDQPINLAGAFEKPVAAGIRGYVEESERAFVNYAASVYADYAAGPDKAWVVGTGFESFAEKVNLSELLGKIEYEIEQYVTEGK